MGQAETNSSDVQRQAGATAARSPSAVRRVPVGLLIAGVCLLALGGGALVWQVQFTHRAPAPVPVDPATTVRRSPGTVPAPTVTGAVKRTSAVEAVNPADAERMVKSKVTPWSKVEQERAAARAAWLKAEAARRERERQAAIAAARQAAAEEAARRERLAAQRAAEQAAQQRAQAQPQPSDMAPQTDSAAPGTSARLATPPATPQTQPPAPQTPDAPVPPAEAPVQPAVSGDAPSATPAPTVPAAETPSEIPAVTPQTIPAEPPPTSP